MKKIGILGGMSWESTQEYYRLLNEAVRKHYGGLHSADLIIRSYDFELIADLQHQKKWGQLLEILKIDALSLQSAGAEAILIATNTMHILADEIQKELHIPLLNIVDATAMALKKQNLAIPLLLGTSFTMESDFYASRMFNSFDISLKTPDINAKQRVHEIIYQELVQGQFSDSSRTEIEQIVAQQKADHQIDSVILGCTELPMLLKKSSLKIPLIDTTQEHVNRVLAFLLT